MVDVLTVIVSVYISAYSSVVNGTFRGAQEHQPFKLTVEGSIPSRRTSDLDFGYALSWSRDRANLV
jgi:hypothetical protein